MPDWPGKVPAQQPGTMPSIGIFRKSYLNSERRKIKYKYPELDKVAGKYARYGEYLQTHTKVLPTLKQRRYLKEREKPHANRRVESIARLYQFML